MKIIMRMLCLLAILCAAGLVFTQMRDGEKPAIEDIESGAEEFVDQMKDMYEEYGSAAVAQADEKLNDVVGQADEKLGEVVEQADEAIGKRSKALWKVRKKDFGKHERKHRQLF